MASIITATTTSGLTQSADNSGVLQLASGTGNLVTIPSVTGTAMVSGNMPAFSAYATQNTQSIANSTETTVTYQNEFFDTASCYNISTGIFTPTVAGYYQLSWSVVFYSAITTGEFYSYLSKNGNGSQPIQMGWDTVGGTYVYGYSSSAVVYANGTTDNFRINVGQATGSAKTISAGSFFTGCLIRTA
jgi:hypothetical protein